MKSAVDLSIILPAYNEANRIIPTLEGIDSYFSLMRKTDSVELIIVDDGSTDETVKIDSQYLEKLNQKITADRISGSLIVLGQNFGKGIAVKRGVEKSVGSAIIYMDSDGSTKISEIEKLLPHIVDRDVIIGSRRERELIKEEQPFYRIALGRAGSVLSRLAVGQISDTQCGFKLFRGEVARNIFGRSEIDRFGFDIEVLAIARVLKYRIEEVPIIWSHKSGGSLRPFADGARSFVELLKIYRNLFSGRYR